MKRSIRYILVVLATVLMSSSALASVRFIDDFESYNLPDGGVIGGGWTWFLNGWTDWPTCQNYWFGFGPNPAPNSNGPYFVSNIGEGDTGQALNVFSDYGNPDLHEGGCAEVNVFQERLLSASDTGSYTFRFEAQETDDLGVGVQAYGFIKIINPNPPYDTLVFKTVDTTTGGTKLLSINLGANDVGKLLQFGFTSLAGNYQASGRFYDNVSFAVKGSGSYKGDLIGVPIPFWAYLVMIGLLVLVGGTALRSRKDS
jgi:hypothetical protein